jgi:signal transduction histidine kinase
LAFAFLGSQPLAQTMELRQAQVSVTVRNLTTHQVVALPYLWDKNNAGQAGKATFELPFELQTVPVVPYGLYIPRLGNAYEIWLNGNLLHRDGDMFAYNGADFAKAPRHILISPGLLRTSNLIRVLLRADVGRNGGLAPLTLGPDEEVHPLYLHDYHANMTASFVVVIVSLQVAIVALALWLTQVGNTLPGRPLRDPLYLYAGLTELCGALSVSDLLIESTPLPWPAWRIAPELAAIGWECGLTLFCVEVAGWGQNPPVTWLRRWLTLLIGVSLGAAVLFNGDSPAVTLIYIFAELTFVSFVSLFVWTTARGGSQSQKMVAVAVSIYLLVEWHHLYADHLSANYSDHTYLRYACVVLGLVLGFVVLLRFRNVSVQIGDNVGNLAQRVAQKEHEISQNYQRTEQLVREYERNAERARILRDMHDGVGSHISTAIRQLQSGGASPEAVLRTLHESLDQLKLTIDGINLPPGDIAALMANLRYRLEPRFKSSDIELRWDVDPMEPLKRLDEKAMRHLQYLMFEALSNVLQHAHASKLGIELHRTPVGGVRLRVIDNGRGFETERVKDRGLRSMRERAAAIDARLSVTSIPGNTVVQVELD